MATRKTQKKNCSDYKQTTKQDNKEINMHATNARPLRLLHILHPLGIKDRHQCKYREHPTLYKNGLLFSLAGGRMSRTNFVSHQNKLQL